MDRKLQTARSVRVAMMASISPERTGPSGGHRPAKEMGQMTTRVLRSQGVQCVQQDMR